MGHKPGVKRAELRKKKTVACGEGTQRLEGCKKPEKKVR